MKKIIKKTVLICDRCNAEIYVRQYLMFECPICGKECCSNCNERNAFDPIPDVCKICAKIPEIEVFLKTLKNDYWLKLKKAKEELRDMKR